MIGRGCGLQCYQPVNLNLTMANLQLCEECSRHHHLTMLNQMPAAFCENIIHQHIENRPLPLITHTYTTSHISIEKQEVNRLGSSRVEGIRLMKIMPNALIRSCANVAMRMKQMGKVGVLKDITNISNSSIKYSPELNCNNNRNSTLLINNRNTQMIQSRLKQTQPHSIQTQPHSIQTKLHSIQTQPHSIQTQAQSIRQPIKHKAMLATIQQQSTQTDTQYSSQLQQDSKYIVGGGEGIKQGRSKQKQAYVLAGVHRLNEQMQNSTIIPDQHNCCCFY